jgi:hypothetical protein
MSQHLDWRSMVAVHPAADLFPMVSDAELDELAKDIDANGQRSPLSIWRSLPEAEWQLLDGRNRVAALARLVDGEDRIRGAITVANQYEAHIDPVAFVISANIRRRHLTPEQKRDLIAKVLRADSTRSDRAVAAATQVSHHTVASVRNDLRDGGQIAHHDKRVGSDGIAQPAHKPQPSKEAQLRALREQQTAAPQRMTTEARQRIQGERQAEANSVPIRDEAVTREAVRRELRNFIRLLGSLLTRTALIPHTERIDRVREIAKLLGVTAADLEGGQPQ